MMSSLEACMRIVVVLSLLNACTINAFGQSPALPLAVPIQTAPPVTPNLTANPALIGSVSINITGSLSLAAGSPVKLVTAPAPSIGGAISLVAGKSVSLCITGASGCGAPIAPPATTLSAVMPGKTLVEIGRDAPRLPAGLPTSGAVVVGSNGHVGELPRLQVPGLRISSHAAIGENGRIIFMAD